MLAYVFPDAIYPSQGIQGNAAWALEVDVVANWVLAIKLEKCDSAVAKLGIIL